MNRDKRLRCFMFFLILAGSIAAMRNVSQAAPDIWVRIINHDLYEQARVYSNQITADPGETFKVDIIIENVEDLFGWQVYLEWNATILDYKNITEGPFIKNQTESTLGTVFALEVEQDQQGMDYIFPAVSTKGEYLGVSGSGILATVEFEVEGKGETILHLYDVKLRNHAGWPLEPNDGDPDYYFTNLKDASFINVGVPVALFTFDPPKPEVNQTVTFDASTSYDTTENGNITLYSWDFGDQTVANETSPTVTHKYVEAREFTVALTVYDDINLTDTEIVQLTVKFAHDIAVLDVHPVKSEISAGEEIPIVVVVSNEGLAIETFDVTVNYDSTPVGPDQTVLNLEPDNNETLTFTWDTTGVAPGTYRIEAIASAVEGEVAAAQVNNAKKAGTVTITETSVAFPWEIVALAGVGVVVVIAVGFLLWRRRGS